MNIDQKLSCSLDDLIKKEKKRRGGRHNNKNQDHLSKDIPNSRRRDRGGTRMRKNKSKPPLNRFSRGKGGRPLPDVLMSDVTKSRRIKSQLQPQRKKIAKPLLGGLFVNKNRVVGKRRQASFKGRVKPSSSGFSSERGKFMARNAVALRANTSLARRQLGYRPVAASRAFQRRNPTKLLAESGISTINKRQKIGLRQQNLSTPRGQGPLIRKQKRSLNAFYRRRQASDDDAKNRVSYESLVKQIKIVADLDRVSSPLLAQTTVRNDRVGRFGKPINVAQRRRPMTLSDRFS